jgi:hypothetical protein
MLYSQLPFSVEQNTTLNEKFEILAGVTPDAGKYPAAKYYCIGNGGHKMSTGTGGIALSDAQQHKATDASLFSPLPFVLRATNNDISNAAQQKYGLRKQETYNSQNYYAYYLKRIPTDQAVLTTSIQTVNGDTTTTTGFVPAPGNLAPQPTVLDPDTVNLLSGQYLTVSATLPLVLTADEITEILNAAEIIWGSPKYAIISEIGLVSAVDYPITLPNSNTMNEAICAQIGVFIATNHVLQFTPTGLNGSFDVGTNEPLLVLEPTE